jgi:sugar lactone lactonase YvrE
MTPVTTAELVVDSACLLGEGPTWDAAGGRLLWLDIDARTLHRLGADGRHTRVELGARVTAVVPTAGGGLVAAADCAVVHLDDQGRPGATIAALPPDGDGVTNDARCDPAGRLWVGTVDRSGAGAAGLFRVSADGHVATIRGGVGLSNGLDWSPDGRTCHYVDSFARCIQELHLDDAGDLVGTSILAEVDAIPDGLTVDAEGGVWVALWDGGAVHRYLPDGRLDRVVAVPGGFVTSCAFGGDAGTTLYITTARTELPDGQLRAQPHAGGLFAADVGVPGRGYTPFGGA